MIYYVYFDSLCGTTHRKFHRLNICVPMWQYCHRSRTCSCRYHYLDQGYCRYHCTVLSIKLQNITATYLVLGELWLLLFLMPSVLHVIYFMIYCVPCGYLIVLRICYRHVQYCCCFIDIWVYIYMARRFSRWYTSMYLGVCLDQWKSKEHR